MTSDNRRITALVMRAMLTDKRSIDEVIIDSTKNIKRDGAKRYAERYEMMLGDAAKTPAFTAEHIKGLVDAMVTSRFDLQKLPSSGFAFGIPSTPQEFENYYAQEAKRGVDAQKAVSNSARAFQDDTLLEAKARILATRYKYSTIPVAHELASRGVDPTHFVEESARYMLKPAEIDLAQLSPNLTGDERQFIEQHARLARLYSEKGLLVSTAENAPPRSGWAQRVMHETSLEAADALGKFTKR